MKIEFDLPNFENEFSISVVLKKDGEAISVVSSPQGASVSAPELKKEIPSEKKTSKNSTKKSGGGNMMDITI